MSGVSTLKHTSTHATIVALTHWHTCAHTRFCDEKKIICQAGHSLHVDATQSPTCMIQIGAAFAAASAKDVKRRSQDDTAADWMLYDSDAGSYITDKTLTYKVHMCPASAKAQDVQRADCLLVVQNNCLAKPCVRMKTQINNIRSGEHLIILTKMISQDEFLELHPPPVNLCMKRTFARVIPRKRKAPDVGRI